MPITPDPGFHAEAFHLVMRLLAAKHEAGDQSTDSERQVLDVPWAVSIGEAVATYLGVLAKLSGMEEEQEDGPVDHDRALDECIRIWRSQGWRIDRQDELTEVIVGLAEEAVSWVVPLMMAMGPPTPPLPN